MNLITKFRAAYRNYFTTFWHSLWACSDVGFRRMCVMASLHAQLVRCSSDDVGSIQRLNERMQLVADSNAMKLPTLFGKVIWKNIPSIDKVDLNSDRIVRRIIRSMPCWLDYGTKEKLETDIKSLLGYCAEEQAKCK